MFQLITASSLSQQQVKEHQLIKNGWLRFGNFKNPLFFPQSVVLTIDTDQPTEQEMDIMVRPPSAKQNRRNQIILGAPSEYIQTSWIDGFSCLRKEKASCYLPHLLITLRSEVAMVEMSVCFQFTSAAFADDVNLISNLELRIRLFGLNLDTVPTKPFERPPSYPDLEGLIR